MGGDVANGVGKGERSLWKAEAGRCRVGCLWVGSRSGREQMERGEHREQR